MNQYFACLSKTYLIFKEIYLSGMRPSLPLTVPIHQSLDTCFLSANVSPFRNDSSLFDRALKSNCTVASTKSTHSTSSQRIIEIILSGYLFPSQLTVFRRTNLRVRIFSYLLCSWRITYFTIMETIKIKFKSQFDSLHVFYVRVLGNVFFIRCATKLCRK